MKRLENGIYEDQIGNKWFSVWAYVKKYNIRSEFSNGVISSMLVKQSPHTVVPTELNTPWKTVRAFPESVLKIFFSN